jgi:RND family efflux transporter MFP subunit
MFSRVSPACAAALLLCACSAKEPTREDVRIVRTTTVSLADEGSRSEYSGEVRARHESTIGFRIAGRVAARLVEIGSRVKQGQPLARLEAGDAELNTGAARAQLEGLQTEYAQAKLDFERAQRLFERRFISQAELDRDRVSLESTRARLASAEAEFNLASNQEAYALLRAPQDGVVTEVHVEAGEVVQAGQPALSISADGEREVAIGIPESRLAEIREADTLHIELWARPGRYYVGRLRELAPTTDSATRLYTARIAIVDADPSIELGMTARVRFESRQDDRTYRLPLTALYQKGGDSFVWVVASDSSIVHSRAVQVADVGPDAIVVSEGLEPGETIVTAGVHLLFEGQKVRRADAPAEG